MNHPYQNPSHFKPIPTTGSLLQDHQDRDRVPQWTEAETKELLLIRGELDQSFTETKRNKHLWETVSSRIQNKGFSRTPEQCKSKWKNLVTRYKSSEAMEEDQKFPFHEEMRTIFFSRMERLHWLEKGKEKVDEEDEKFKKKKRKMKEGGGMEVVKAIREVMSRHVEMEKRWMEATEMREAERRWKEGEWRREIAALEEERMAMERRWKEREEEWFAREEERNERQHDIIAAIITKVFEK